MSTDETTPDEETELNPYEGLSPDEMLVMLEWEGWEARELRAAALNTSDRMEWIPFKEWRLRFENAHGSITDRSKGEMEDAYKIQYAAVCQVLLAAVQEIGADAEGEAPLMYVKRLGGEVAALCKGSYIKSVITEADLAKIGSDAVKAPFAKDAEDGV